MNVLEWSPRLCGSNLLSEQGESDVSSKVIEEDSGERRKSSLYVYIHEKSSSPLFVTKSTFTHGTVLLMSSVFLTLRLM